MVTGAPRSSLSKIRHPSPYSVSTMRSGEPSSTELLSEVFRFDRRKRALRRMYWNWPRLPASASGPTHPWYTVAQLRPLLRPVDDKAGELAADAFDRYLLATVPVRHRVGHAEDTQHRQTGIEIRAKLALPHTFPDNVLEHALEPARPFSDPSAAFGRQVLAVIQEHSYEVAAIGQRSQV